MKYTIVDSINILVKVFYFLDPIQNLNVKRKVCMENQQLLVMAHSKDREKVTQKKTDSI